MRAAPRQSDDFCHSWSTRMIGAVDCDGQVTSRVALRLSDTLRTYAASLGVRPRSSVSRGSLRLG